MSRRSDHEISKSQCSKEGRANEGTSMEIRDAYNTLEKHPLSHQFRELILRPPQRECRRGQYLGESVSEGPELTGRHLGAPSAITRLTCQYTPLYVTAVATPSTNLSTFLELTLPRNPGRVIFSYPGTYNDRLPYNHH